jgi:ATP-dependent RNA helicase RhlE
MITNQFTQFSLNEKILSAVEEEGYVSPTPVQEATIPQVLAGRDLLATAQTGTGKTAAFALPILHLLNERKTDHKDIRALILTPTRELALQIDESLRSYGRHLSLHTTVILGGISQSSQVKSLRNKPEILVATPGRLLDLYGQKLINLEHIEILVLDEADRMLDMGFITDVRKIVSKLPRKRQTLFFSATLSWEIAELASDMLNDPAQVEITPAASVSGNIEQKVMFVEQANKRDLLTEVLSSKEVRRALVFARTRHQADRLSKQLTNCGISADAIHSDKTQSARQKALSAFDRGRIKVLVGTDIVARGIDVEGISHVVNYELPNDPESYVHRIGRTARAGAAGTALSFCAADEIEMLMKIEKLTLCKLTMVDHQFHSTAIADLRERKAAPKRPVPAFGRARNEKSRRAGRGR